MFYSLISDVRFPPTPGWTSTGYTRTPNIHMMDPQYEFAIFKICHPLDKTDLCHDNPVCYVSFTYLRRCLDPAHS